MNFYQIITTVYASQWALNQFTLGDANDGQGIFITSWNVPNVTQPTHAEVMAMETPEMAFQYAYDTFLSAYLAQLRTLIDGVARQRNYDDAISCLSYLSSTNGAWKLESETFSAWRDAAWTYLYAQQVLILDKTRAIPTIEQLNAELPVIVWPS